MAYPGYNLGVRPMDLLFNIAGGHAVGLSVILAANGRQGFAMSTRSVWSPGRVRTVGVGR